MANEIELKELANYLNAFLDPNRIQESSPNGVLVANDMPIKKIATAVSASLETIEKAAVIEAQALIVHHGRIFSKNESCVITEIKYQKIKKLIRNNIALLSYHLPLDAHREIGNNWKAAKDIGMQNLQPFLEYEKHLIGVIGDIKPTSFEQFKKQIETYYGNNSMAVKVKDSITKVAIVSGGADKFIKDAAKAGADCFITGRVDEPVWEDAHEYNISFLGLGHYATETVGPKALAENLQQKFGIECCFIDTGNPF